MEIISLIIGLSIITVQNIPNILLNMYLVEHQVQNAQQVRNT
jgi:hypothetical protein